MGDKTGQQNRGPRALFPGANEAVASGECSAEYNAMIQAHNDLVQAELAYDEAYEAWQECSYGMGGGGYPTTEIHISEQHSVLKR